MISGHDMYFYVYRLYCLFFWGADVSTCGDTHYDVYMFTLHVIMSFLGVGDEFGWCVVLVELYGWLLTLLRFIGNWSCILCYYCCWTLRYLCYTWVLDHMLAFMPIWLRCRVSVKWTGHAEFSVEIV